MKNRYIKNWISTVFGLAIMVLGGVLLYQSKIDYVAFGVIEAGGAALAHLKEKDIFKNEDN